MARFILAYPMAGTDAINDSEKYKCVYSSFMCFQHEPLPIYYVEYGTNNKSWIYYLWNSNTFFLCRLQHFYSDRI